MGYLLDTNILVDYFRGRHGLSDLLVGLAREGGLAISLITYGELIYGTHYANDPQKEEIKLENFLSDFSIEIVLLTKEIIKIYAEAKFRLEKKGKRIDEFDLLIGATAVVSDLTLVTRNTKHFKNFPGLRLYN